MAEQTIQKIKEEIERVNNYIKPYKIDYVNILKECELVKKNARFMTHQQLNQLAKNIKRDGFLSQLPFAVKKENGKYKIISGNHRIKAAIKAGVKYTLILYVNSDEVNKEKEIAIQLSHNAITGQDDYSILAELYNELKDFELKEYSGIDEKELFNFQYFDLPSINEADIYLHEIKIYFSDETLKNTEKILKELEKRAGEGAEQKYIHGDYYKFIEIMTKIKKRFNIKNNTVAFLKMIEICEEYLKDGKKE